MFCDKLSYKKDKCLIKVVSDESCDTLEERANGKKDTNMDCKVGPIYRKLIVHEAKNHKACQGKYIKVKS